MSRSEAIEKLREILLDKRVELQRSLLQGEEELSGKPSAPLVADAALDSANTDIAGQLVDSQSRALRRIDAALARMRHGTYGSCELCDCEIPTVRLEALPFAIYCRACQAEHERQESPSHRKPSWNIPVLELNADLVQ
jgi:DnaK suppressor protein